MSTVLHSQCILYLPKYKCDQVAVAPEGSTPVLRQEDLALYARHPSHKHHGYGGE